MNASFEKLIQRNGGFSLPYLIHLYDVDGNINMYYVNNSEDVIYNGMRYVAGTFKYTPNATEHGFDGGGSLEITIKENQVVDLIENYRNIKLDVIGVIDEQGLIAELKHYKHHYGKVSATRSTATFTFNKDDRLGMTFPTLIWNNQNNRGNN